MPLSVTVSCEIEGINQDGSVREASYCSVPPSPGFRPCLLANAGRGSEYVIKPCKKEGWRK